MKSMPLTDISSLAEDVYTKTREASEDIDLDTRELLLIHKA